MCQTIQFATTRLIVKIYNILLQKSHIHHVKFQQNHITFSKINIFFVKAS